MTATNATEFQGTTLEATPRESLWSRVKRACRGAISQVKAFAYRTAYVAVWGATRTVIEPVRYWLNFVNLSSCVAVQREAAPKAWHYVMGVPRLISFMLQGALTAAAELPFMLVYPFLGASERYENWVGFHLLGRQEFAPAGEQVRWQRPTSQHGVESWHWFQGSVAHMAAVTLARVNAFLAGMQVATIQEPAAGAVLWIMTAIAVAINLVVEYQNYQTAYAAA